MAKTRLDVLLAERGLAPSRSKAQALILAGEVLVNDEPIDKVGQLVSDNAAIRLRNPIARFVSRGGEKIDPIFTHFGIDTQDKIALDIGASTGGFTDCLLSRGAKKVYAVDVGRNQLAHKLRVDPRVIVMEKTNARDINPNLFPEKASIVTMDVSFISVMKILPALANVVQPLGQILVLVKPQFELSPADVEKGGVVKRVEKQLEAVSMVQRFAETIKLTSNGVTPSPLRGEKKGNQEYFLLLTYENH